MAYQPLTHKSLPRFQTSVIELLQDVVLPVLCLFHIRSGDPHANELEGGCLVTVIHREVLTEVTEQYRDWRW